MNLNDAWKVVQCILNYPFWEDGRGLDRFEKAMQDGDLLVVTSLKFKGDWVVLSTCKMAWTVAKNWGGVSDLVLGETEGMVRTKERAGDNRPYSYSRY